MTRSEAEDIVLSDRWLAAIGETAGGWGLEAEVIEAMIHQLRFFTEDPEVAFWAACYEWDL